MYKKIKNIHMIGIGGAGMSGIAEVLINLDYNVSGSDLKKSDVSSRLEKLGAKVYYGHRKQNVGNADIIVVSTAIDRKNPEIIAANKLKIPVIRRIEMLAELARMKYTIGIAGTHGKTTTTSMIGLLLQSGGFDPTVIIGGKLKNFGSGTRLGEGKFFVAEADESDGSFLKLSPSISIVTNIDDDHLDYYGDVGALKKAFVEYMNKVPFYGCCIVCIDDPGVRSVLPLINRRYYTYGLDGRADIRARNVKFGSRKVEFEAVCRGKILGKIYLNVRGIHNVRNALAAVACGIELEMPFSKIHEALLDFGGVARRLELKGYAGGVHFIDDYGHHPTEIAATIEALKNDHKGKLVVVFQPHRFTRTKLLLEKFGPAFRHADVVRVMQIYSAGEKKVAGIGSGMLVKRIRKYCRDTELFNPGATVDEIIGILKPEDVVLTLGAGDVWKLHEEMISKWKKKKLL